MPDFAGWRTFRPGRFVRVASARRSSCPSTLLEENSPNGRTIDAAPVRGQNRVVGGNRVCPDAKLSEGDLKMKWATGILLMALVPSTAGAQVNGGDQKPEATVPFNTTTVATFTLPWRIAFLPDGRMLVTEKAGPLWLVTQ